MLRAVCDDLPKSLRNVPLRLTRRWIAPPLLPVLGWSELIKAPLLVEPSKARERLGWQPRFTSEQALGDTRATIGW